MLRLTRRVRDMERVMRILNFPDVGEEPESACYRELLKHFPEEQVGTVRRSLTETEPNKLLMSCIADGPFDLIVGLGFGAVFALLAGRATGSRTVLVNPLCPVQRYLPVEYPAYGFDKELAGLEHGRICWDSRRSSLENVFVILSKDDPVADSARTAGYFRDGHSFYVEGGHIPCGEDFSQVFSELVNGIEPMDGGTEAVDVDDEDGTALVVEGRAFVAGDSEASEGGPDGLDGAEGPKEPPFDLETYNVVRVDELDGSDGHVVIRWSREGEEPKAHTLYLYYADGAWRRDEEDGVPSKGRVLAAVLAKASAPFIAQAEPTAHPGHDFWGWAWQ